MSTALLTGLFDVGDCIYKSNSSKAITMGILEKRSLSASTAPSGVFGERRHRSPKFHEFCFKAESALQQQQQHQQQQQQQPQQQHTQQQQHNQQQQPPPHVFAKEGRFRDRSYSEGGERPALHRVASAGSAAVLPCGPGGIGLSGGGNSSSRYKTELCRPFEESGACKYADKCQFAHGGHELRTLVRHPKYKTELCRTFHTIGFCPYGPRCHFIHNAEEKRSASRGGAGDRPRLQHSLSFSGFSTPATLGLDSPPRSPESLTPPLLLVAAGGYAEADGGAGFPPAPGGSSGSSSPGSSPPPAQPSCGYGTGGTGVYANNAFAFSSRELAGILAPFGMSRAARQQIQLQLRLHAPPAQGQAPGAEGRQPQLPQPPVALAGSEPPPSPPASSLSDPDSAVGSSVGSSACGSIGSGSGSESPVLDPNRRLPIFSRLSVTDD